MTDPPTITLRPVTEHDEALLLAWANDPVTRAAGFRPAPISPSDHHRWLSSRLSSASGRSFIGMSGTTPIGQVRLDRDPDGLVEIGISVAPEARGRGIGRSLLEGALDAARHDTELAPTAFVARIRPDNAASIALFSGAGFRPDATIEIAGLACLVFRAEV